MKKNWNWRNPYLPLIIICVIVALIGFFFVKQGEKNRAIATVEADDTLAEIYQRVVVREQELNRESTGEMYNVVLFDWKSLGDATQQKYFFNKAINITKKAERAGQAESSLFALNTANLYKLTHQFDKAEDYYIKATRLAPGDATLWMAYIDLYVNWAKKPPAQTIALFERALNTLIDKTNVTVEKASYLQSIGQYQQSLEIYQALKVAYPGNTGFATKIAELKLLIQQ